MGLDDTVHFGEHAGTHLDAPVHWISGRNGKSVDQIEPYRLIGPLLIVIDKSADVAENLDFLLEPEHFEQWQESHGQLPDNCWVILRTGWSSRGGNAAEFVNADDAGPHTPGVSVAGAQWIAANTSISGFGVETVGMDAGQAATLTRCSPSTRFSLGRTSPA